MQCILRLSLSVLAREESCHDVRPPPAITINKRTRAHALGSQIRVVTIIVAALGIEPENLLIARAHECIIMRNFSHNVEVLSSEKLKRFTTGFVFFPCWQLVLI
jgi:hypothetical protein